MKAFASSFEHDGQDYVVVSRPRSWPRAFESLTPTELLVAEGVVEGTSIRALAHRRGVSERTISNQMAGIYRKLGIGSRRELTALVSAHDT